MFVFVKDYRFRWPVKVEVPVDGAYETQEFTGRFRVLEEAELQAVVQQGDEALANAVMVGFEDVSIDGAPVPYSAELLERMLQQRHVRRAVGVAYFEAMNGDLRAKN